MILIFLLPRLGSVSLESNFISLIRKNETKDKRKRNHQILFYHIESETKLNFRVKAQSIFGNKAISLQTYKAEISYSSSKDLRIPIHRCSTAEFIEKNSVVGIPFQKGLFWIGEKLKVDAIEQRRFVDYQPTSFWSDGSIKWIKVFLKSGDFSKDICYLKKINRSSETDDIHYPESAS